ncbi:MAG: hypothetical protein JWQ30_2764 [Sediminibacterium sp.]|nr:hypothetical protein [Sediminibacterium sp.]
MPAKNRQVRRETPCVHCETFAGIAFQPFVCTYRLQKNTSSFALYWQGLEVFGFAQPGVNAYGFPLILQ